MANVLEEIWSPIRKYLIPDSLGGGHTEKEKEEIRKNYEEVKDKTWSDTAADIAGISPGNGLLWVGIILLIVMVFKD